MGITKSNIFSQDINNLAGILKTLGHPARLSILKLIAQRNTCICGDLVEDIGLAQATISQHLRELKNADLIVGTIEGTSICYCINATKMQQIQTVINEFFSIKINSNNCC